MGVIARERNTELRALLPRGRFIAATLAAIAGERMRICSSIVHPCRCTGRLIQPLGEVGTGRLNMGRPILSFAHGTDWRLETSVSALESKEAQLAMT